jgi:Flp pilus assembly pilin Flp
MLETLSRDCSGATALEYGLIIAFISIMVVAWATTVGTSVCGFFVSINNGF